tara:strand:- start:27796 stop:28332 length:537 start_codon:yes stop_codon:yes gene_type:complete
MARTENPVSSSIEIAASSKALLLHVQGIEPLEAEASPKEFCGSSLLKAQIGISPMLLALSMELALKAWIVYDGTKPNVPRDHDLSELFSYTSSATQERLKARYDIEISPRHPSPFPKDNGLEHILKDARKAFVDWRYAYELDNARFDVGVFKETIELVLSEFESEIIVVKHMPPLSRL